MKQSFFESFRLDDDTKNQLSTLKRRTGIANWNTLCRWGFCLSLADAKPVRDRQDRELGAIEMTWKTFAGEYDEIYRLLLIERCQKEHGTLEREMLVRTLRQHITRGIGWMATATGVQSLSDLVALTQERRRRVA